MAMMKTTDTYIVLLSRHGLNGQHLLQVKHVSRYFPDRRGTYGLHDYCRTCANMHRKYCKATRLAPPAAAVPVQKLCTSCGTVSSAACPPHVLQPYMHALLHCLPCLFEIVWPAMSQSVPVAILTEITIACVQCKYSQQFALDHTATDGLCHACKDCQREQCDARRHSSGTTGGSLPAEC